jgi:8-oxo-dGTP diphosphatase
MLYLVRHAKAGSRSCWTDDDRQRPLTDAGRMQAEMLADRLTDVAVGEFVSSPYVRCMQTIEPLAARCGTQVRADDRLAEDTRFAGAMELLGELPDGSVLCSHGDVIPETIAALERRGCRILTEPDWRKASIWVLARNADGVITDASAMPPPDDD